ncbi:YfhD-like protein [Evansella caseinilytica]|uniref:YfhD-like protein n=1 Tax=Evansella caseinilytica TaxID=1503961 RepID=A0A1H3J155_9BACI|nr:YfhD family protein [Evansella caseinilytica]SDY33632.1 YfhD-like protein [Evansella caseinilytica]
MKRDKQQDKAPLNPEAIDDNEYVEYSEELADVEDRDAQARAKEANRRVNKENI